MEPSIQIYNNLINQPQQIWLNILAECPGIQLQCDFMKYEQLCLYLGNIVKNLPNSSHFLYDFDHHGILTSFDKWNIGQQQYKLFNIDHHHDCGYPIKGDETYEDLRFPITCANWMLTLAQAYPNCKDYIWICNKNSKDLVPDVSTPHLPSVYQTCDINMINYIKFDYVFLCKSEPWVPPQYYPLYDSLTHLLEKIIIK